VSKHKKKEMLSRKTKLLFLLSAIAAMGIALYFHAGQQITATLLVSRIIDATADALIERVIV